MSDKELPPGWVSVSLGEIFSPRYGKAIPKDKRHSSFPYPIVGSAGAMGGSKSALVEEPCIVIGRKGNIGHPQVFSDGCWPIDTTYYIVPPKQVSLKFVFYQLESISWKKFDSSTATPSLRRGDLEAIEFKIPPLLEQERIVDTIEDHLSRLDAATETLRRGNKRVPALRGGIRGQIACLNDPSMRLPEGWAWGVLADVLTEIQAGRSFQCEARPAAQGEWGVIKVSAMTWGEFRPHENKAVIAGRDIDGRNEVHSGDILVSRANTSEYVGAPVIVRGCPEKLLLSDKSLRLVPKSGIDREWLLQVLSSPYVRRQISDKATGTKDSMRNISQKSLGQVRIAIPPASLMENIGADISVALAQVQDLHDSLSKSIARASNLRDGVLRQAFSGKLIQQNPSDEPASVLLERIRAERAAQPKLKRSRASKKTASASSRPAPAVTSEPAGTFVQEELGL